MENKVQEEYVTRLEQRGFHVTGRSQGIEPGTVAVMMVKKVGRTTTLMAEIEADGSINGKSFEGFAAWAAAEEKKR